MHEFISGGPQFETWLGQTNLKFANFYDHNSDFEEHPGPDHRGPKNFFLYEENSDFEEHPGCNREGGPREELGN